MKILIKMLYLLIKRIIYLYRNNIYLINRVHNNDNNDNDSNQLQLNNSSDSLNKLFGTYKRFDKKQRSKIRLIRFFCKKGSNNI